MICRDVALYALGVGSGAGDPVEALELPFVYKHFFTDEIKVTHLHLENGKFKIKDCGIDNVW